MRHNGSLCLQDIIYGISNSILMQFSNMKDDSGIEPIASNRFEISIIYMNKGSTPSFFYNYYCQDRKK